MADQGGSTVGPGEYSGANVAACEPQVDSRKVTSGAIKFGTGYKKGMNNKKLDLGNVGILIQFKTFSVAFSWSVRVFLLILFLLFLLLMPLLFFWLILLRLSSFPFLSIFSPCSSRSFFYSCSSLSSPSPPRTCYLV